MIPLILDKLIFTDKQAYQETDLIATKSIELLQLFSLLRGMRDLYPIQQEMIDNLVETHKCIRIPNVVIPVEKIYERRKEIPHPRSEKANTYVDLPPGYHDTELVVLRRLDQVYKGPSFIVNRSFRLFSPHERMSEDTLKELAQAHDNHWGNIIDTLVEKHNFQPLDIKIFPYEMFAESEQAAMELMGK
tara:strand:+ start:111 stop:677 length:567 start_codon:yes stop_codon:yes gene_type:complete